MPRASITRRAMAKPRPQPPVERSRRNGLERVKAENTCSAILGGNPNAIVVHVDEDRSGVSFGFNDHARSWAYLGVAQQVAQEHGQRLAVDVGGEILR